MGQDRLGDLRPDPVDRVERVQRALEHDRGAGPADGAQVAPAHGEDVVPSKSTSPVTVALGGWSRRIGAGQGRLAAAGLPRDADDLAALDGQVDAADGGQAASAGARR